MNSIHTKVMTAKDSLELLNLKYVSSEKIFKNKRFYQIKSTYEDEKGNYYFINIIFDPRHDESDFITFNKPYELSIMSTLGIPDEYTIRFQSLVQLYEYICYVDITNLVYLKEF